MAAPAVIHQIWINQRPWPRCLSLFFFSNSLPLSFFFSLRFPSFYISSFYTFLRKVVCYWYRVHFHRKRYFSCQDFSLLSRQATKVVAQIAVIRNNIIMFVRTLGSGIISLIAFYPNETGVYYFPQLHIFVFWQQLSVKLSPSILVLSSTSKDKIVMEFI